VTASDRFIELAGAGNVRDLGGLPTADGRQTRRGRILRSDFLVNLSPDDERALLREFGLKTVIDLRTASEVESFPGPWEERGVDVVRASFPLDPAFAANGTDDMVGLYLSFLEPPAAAAGAALKALIAVERHPLLIHCAAGKDRTGVLVALALELLGVEREALVADYVLTHARMPAVLARLEVEAGRTRTRTLPAVMYGADAETIESFLAGLEWRFGGAAAWALDQGISAAAIEAFRAGMLIPTN
jgi:protein tyrosine/serine phosphatase